jgi:hypothetical protein
LAYRTEPARDKPSWEALASASKGPAQCNSFLQDAMLQFPRGKCPRCVQLIQKQEQTRRHT